MATLHWTSEDLKRLPDDGQRYEIVDGELYVSKQPDINHQFAETLTSDIMRSPYLPGFSCKVTHFFNDQE
jgi:hypothetical protein